MVEPKKNIWKTAQVFLPLLCKAQSGDTFEITRGGIQGHMHTPVPLTTELDNSYMHHLSSISKLISVYSRLEHETMKQKNDQTSIDPIYIYDVIIY